jgi:Right handed beta helix region
MRRIALLALVIGFFTPFLASAPAHAQATRTWVSGVGDDANPCSRTAPCKTFAGAISKTAPAGEIDCLDPGGFGALTITKSITLNCTATLGSVLVSGTNGITIAAATTDNVVLRNIQIQGIGSGLAGLKILTAASVTIDNCVITQFTQQGISDVRTAGSTKLFVRNTVIQNNAGAGVGLAATGPNNVVLDNVSSTNNLSGLTGATGNNVIAQHSVFSGNSSFGVQADAGSTMNVDNSAISNNGGTGVSASGTIRLSNSTVTFNIAGGSFTSYGNNRTLGNGSDPTITNAGGASSDMGEK